MPLTKAESLLLSNDYLLAGILENESKRIQLAERLPFYPVLGDTLRVERSRATDFGAEPLFDTVPVTITEGKAVPTSSLEAKFELKLLTQDLIPSEFSILSQSAVQNQADAQIQAAIRRFLYRFWKAFYEGDETANSQEFSGIRKLTVTGQTIAPNDTVNHFLVLEDLDRLISKLTSNNGRPHVLFTGPLGYRNIRKAYYDKGLEPEYVLVDAPDSNGGIVQRRMMAFDGIPIYQDQHVRTDETGLGTFTNGTSIYAMVLGRGGVYGIVPAGGENEMIKVDTFRTGSAAQVSYRVLWPVGLVLEKEDGIARLQLRPMAGTS